MNPRGRLRLRRRCILWIGALFGHGQWRYQCNITFSLALFQHKLHTILRLRKTSLGSKSTLKSCDLPAESGMRVLRTTTLVRICTQTRPYIPNGNIATFSFAVDSFSRNCTISYRSQENPANPAFSPSQEQYKISKMCVCYSYFGVQEMD